MVNEIEEKNGRLDHALAQLIVHAPQKQNLDLGPEASLEELAALSEGKLSAMRRQQIFAQFEDKQVLYETWLALNAPQTELSSAKLSTQRGPSILEMFMSWLNQLLSWQGALTATMGIVVGALGILISGTALEDDSLEGTSQHLAINAPLEAPQKANQLAVYEPASRDKIKCYPVAQGGGAEFCASKTASAQHWLYANEAGLLKAIPSPYNTGSLLDVRVLGDKMVLITSKEGGGVDLAVIAYRFNSGQIEYESLYHFTDDLEAAEKVSAIEIQTLDKQGLSFRVLDGEGQISVKTYNF